MPEASVNCTHQCACVPHQASIAAVDSLTTLLSAGAVESLPPEASHETVQSPAGTRRRLLSKTTEDREYAMEVQYAYNHGWPSRRYATSRLAAQGMEQRLQCAAFQNTVGVDMKNAMFAILQQVVHRSGIVDRETWKPELDLLERLATDRETVIQEELKMSFAEGKRILHRLVSGGGIPAHLTKNTTAIAANRLGAWLHLLTRSVLPPSQRGDGDRR